jgi:hypothetical protein
LVLLLSFMAGVRYFCSAMRRATGRHAISPTVAQCAARIPGILRSIVMPALVAGIHVFLNAASKTWMAGTFGPAMTTSSAGVPRRPAGYCVVAALMPSA